MITEKKLETVVLENIKPGDILFRLDDDCNRAMLIGQFGMWFRPYEIMRVYNPADGFYTLVYDIPNDVLILKDKV